VRAASVLPEITPSARRERSDKPVETGMADFDRVPVMDLEAHIEERIRMEYDRGVAMGKIIGADSNKTEYEAKLSAATGRIDGIVSEIREQYSDLYRTSEQAVVKFAFGIAERIIRKEVSLDRSIVLGQIRESVRRVLGVERLRIRVHPDDLAAVREQKSMIQANGDSIRDIVVEGDESLEFGDCVLESDMGNIDARISTQLKQIENVLFESKVVS
jgi:flagellar assembly protein FliH